MIFPTLKVTVLVLIATPNFATEYGPSILSLVRPNATDRSILSFLSPFPFNKSHYTPQLVSLGEFPNYATILPFTEGKSWIKSEEIVEYLGKESIYSSVPIKITAPSAHGVMAVIQELEIPAYNTFNRSLLVIAENGKITKCFSKFEFQIEGKVPVEVCGRTYRQDEHHIPSVLNGVGPRSFIVPEGKSLTIRFIYRDPEIDSNSVLIKQVPYYDQGYMFRASIALTAYRTCPHGPPFYDENNTRLWPCDIPQSNREPVAACIREELYCDNTINCGIHDPQEFALDEKFCVEETDSNYTSRKTNILDVVRMEEAIHSRYIRKRPYSFSLNSMTSPMGAHTGTTDYHLVEPVEKYPTISHPAFIALVVLVSIICVLMLGVLFRFCCKSCVGKLDSYGDSSNPEAVARFHENLQSRDNHLSRVGGVPYGISHDSLFKPSDDFPPSYEDLFPERLNKSCDTLTNANVPFENSARENEFPMHVYTIPVQPLDNAPVVITTNSFTNSSPTYDSHVSTVSYNNESNSRRGSQNTSVSTIRNSVPPAVPSSSRSLKHIQSNKLGV